MHNGIDMVDRAGTPIVAPEKGLVLESRKSTAQGGGYGYYVKLKGASGSIHIFAHMIADSLAVRKGQRITQGTILGKMGTTGASTGVHLHWEVRTNSVAIDPLKWIEQWGAQPIKTTEPKKEEMLPPKKKPSPAKPTSHVVKGAIPFGAFLKNTALP